LTGSNTVFRCDGCNEWYDTSIQDTPIKNITKYRATPHFELQRYPVISDEEDAPFVKAVDLDTVVEDIENRYGDSRIKRIHVKGSFVDAIAASALTTQDED
jgi:hypothetical protein